jgi:hypothetical protein
MAVINSSNADEVVPRKEGELPLRVELVSPRRWQNDAVAYCATIIAIAALVVSIWQAHLSAKYSRLSVRPLLGSSRSFSESYEWTGLVIKNRGIGPAVIRSANIYLDNTLQGKMRLKEWEGLLIRVGIHDKMRLTAFGMDDGNLGTVVPAGDTLPILVIAKGYPRDQ